MIPTFLAYYREVIRFVLPAWADKAVIAENVCNYYIEIFT